MTNGLLDEGTYRGKGFSATLCRSGNGSEQVAIEFELLEMDGYKMTYFGSFTGGALEHTVKALRACGWSGQDLSDLTGIDANEVTLVVGHHEYNGKTTARINWVNPVGAGSPALKSQLAPDEARAFAARMRGAILGLEGPRPAAKPATQRAPAQRANPKTQVAAKQPDSDLPF